MSEDQYTADNAPDTCLEHGSAIALGGCGALICGPSGSGKSDLVLRCLALAPTPLWPVPTEFVADDQVRLTRQGQTISMSPPQAIAGLIEIRNVGILPCTCRASARLCLTVSLVGSETALARMPPDDEARHVMGLRVPALTLNANQLTAPHKLLAKLWAVSR